ncbi:VWA domain-containing protein [Exilibacterium tricleocarpae]|uniref:VWA domain-containing protein n=2 Tax=Exilibacterium tricleocarpae TaxID=2591008 RepID=A0A545TW01_9GAMM|nr:VWA domain-containing protein [Exilibacterium tricleocarpae]
MSLLLFGCSDGGQQINSYQRGVYLLLDTSGTYTEELVKAKQIINYLLAYLEPGDTFVVARIDSASFSEKDIVAKVILDARPSTANKQKREFSQTVNDFVANVKSSAYTDISGGVLQAIEYLNEARVGRKHIFIFSDLKEDLPANFKRDFDFTLDGFTVRALNVTKLRSDNVDPKEYLERVADWQARVVQGGGTWGVINDLDRADALAL